MIRKLILALAILWAAPVMAAGGSCGSTTIPTGSGITSCFFISNAGSDAAAGTTEGTAWAHAPYMPNATGTSAGTTLTAGEGIVYEGNNSWTNASLPMHITTSGNSSNQIGAVLVDKTWFTGAAWGRPLFTAGGTNIGAGCGGLGANWMFYFDNVTYVYIDWADMSGLFWNNDQQSACFRTVGFAIGNASDHITINHSYFHNWSHGTSAGTTDTGSGGMIASYNTTPDCGNCIVENSVMDNSDSADGASCATGGSLCSGGGISSWSSINNIFFDVVEALDTSNYVSTDVVTISGNNISNLQSSFTTPSQASPPHPNCIETLGPSTPTYLIHDNYIHNTFTCEGGQVGNPGEIDYVWNNLWDMGATGVSGNNGPQVPQSTSGSKSLFFWNNTIRWASGCMVAGGHSTTYTGSFVVQNNHCINDTSTVVAGTTPGGATINSNLGMTNATATTQGYTNSQTFVFSPTLITNSTVGAGTNLTSTFAADGLTSTNDTALACTEKTISGVVQSVCPTRTSNSRPASAAWDIGAYQFAGLPTPLPQMLMTGPVQFNSSFSSNLKGKFQ